MLPLQRPQGVGTVSYRNRVHAPSLQEAQDGAAQSLFVVDQQHGQRALMCSSGRRGGCRHGRGRQPLVGARIAHQLDRKRRAATVCLGGLGIEPDAATVVAHDPVTDREAESAAASLGLRREERIEDFLFDVGRDAGARVGHLEAHVILARGRRADRDGAPAGDAGQGLLAIDQEIEQHLLHLRAVRPRLGIALVELEVHRDVERGQMV